MSISSLGIVDWSLWLVVIYVGVLAVLMLVGVPFFASFISEIDQRKHKRSVEPCTDLKCPHCGSWQSGCGGWVAIYAVTTPGVDFFAECGVCGSYSKWVWIGQGIYITYEKISPRTPTAEGAAGSNPMPPSSIRPKPPSPPPARKARDL